MRKTSATNKRQLIYDSGALRIPFLHEISEFRRYRYLLFNLIARDFKVRYKRSFLGIVWAMLNPLLTMIVLVVVFSFIFRFEIEHYPIFILSGLLLWNLFAEGTTFAMRSVLDNSAIIKKIYLPSSVFVTAAIGTALVNLFFGVITLIILAIVMGTQPHIGWLLIPVPIFQVTVFAFGIGSILAALVVFFNDVLHMYTVLLNLFFYLTPIIYPIFILPENIQALQQLNPMYHYISFFRAIILNTPMPDVTSILLSTLAAIVFLIIGWTFFTWQSDRFAYQA